MSGEPKPPVMEADPKLTSIEQAQISLGILTAACSTLGKDKKPVCEQLLKPLEQNKKSPVDTMADVLVSFGEESMDKAVDGFNLILMEATAKAKEQLIAAGKLKKDGSPVE